jgi:hypothetical protein
MCPNEPEYGAFINFCVFGINGLGKTGRPKAAVSRKPWYNNGVHKQGEILAINT